MVSVGLSLKEYVTPCYVHLCDRYIVLFAIIKWILCCPEFIKYHLMFWTVGNQ